jgi:hypothetical protein
MFHEGKPFTYFIFFCFCSTPFFLMVKGIKLKEKVKRKKNQESGSGPLLAGYGLGTRIRATLARILIPGLDTDPRLRIRARVPAGEHGLFGLFCGLLRNFTDFYGLDWYLRRYARVCGLKGGTASKIWVKTRKIVGSA